MDNAKYNYIYIRINKPKGIYQDKEYNDFIYK